MSNVSENRSSIPSVLHINCEGDEKFDTDFYLMYKPKQFIDESKKNWTTPSHYIEFSQKPTLVSPREMFASMFENNYPIRIRLYIDSANRENIVLKLTTQEHYDLLYSALKGLAGKIPVESEEK